MIFLLSPTLLPSPKINSFVYIIKLKNLLSLAPRPFKDSSQTKPNLISYCFRSSSLWHSQAVISQTVHVILCCAWNSPPSSLTNLVNILLTHLHSFSPPPLPSNPGRSQFFEQHFLIPSGRVTGHSIKVTVTLYHNLWYAWDTVHPNCDFPWGQWSNWKHFISSI